MKLPSLAIQGPISSLRLGLAMSLDVTQMSDSYFMRTKNKPFPRNAQAAFWLTQSPMDGPYFYPKVHHNFKGLHGH